MNTVWVNNIHLDVILRSRKMFKIILSEASSSIYLRIFGLSKLFYVKHKLSVECADS